MAGRLYRAAQPKLCSIGCVLVHDATHVCMQLYTSGSTGKPKGVQHTTGGYMVGAALTTKYVFDVQPDDVYWCTADCGWITGHSYVTYGMLFCPYCCSAFSVSALCVPDSTACILVEETLQQIIPDFIAIVCAV